MKGENSMLLNYEEMFKTILKACYEDKLDEKLQQMLDEPGTDKVKLSQIIASLCGVCVEYSDNFIIELKRAILDYDSSKPIITKVSNCPVECIRTSEKTFCETSCAFEAILVDKNNNSVIINKDKCIGCGFCIEACPNKVLLDRIEFIPLLQHFNKKTC
jgi:ferredoxin hydrogenase